MFSKLYLADEPQHCVRLLEGRVLFLSFSLKSLLPLPKLQSPGVENYQQYDSQYMWHATRTGYVGLSSHSSAFHIPSNSAYELFLKWIQWRSIMMRIVQTASGFALAFCLLSVEISSSRKFLPVSSWLFSGKELSSWVEGKESNYTYRYIFSIFRFRWRSMFLH